MASSRLRVLQVITNLGTGGAEKLLVDSIPLYQEKGLSIDLLLLDGTEYPFYKELKDSGTTIYNLGKGSVYKPSHIFKIIPYLKKYDIIHVHLFPTLYWVALAKIFSFSRTKLVFTEHSTSNKRMHLYWGRILDRLIYRKYWRVVSITTEIDLIMKSYLRSEDMTSFNVIENGVDLRKFQDLALPDKGIKQNKVRVIQVSSFNKAKDQGTLIKSLLHLPENVEVDLVGDGENRVKCEALVEELGLTNRVRFLGIQMNVPELLNKADIVVLSSHFEGFGLAAVEGMAAGKPLVASDVPGLNSVVKDAGLLFPVGNEQKLANQIKKLLTDEDFYLKTAIACKERSKNYDINFMVNKYLDLYNNAIKHQ